MKIKYILYVLFISLLSCKESIDETELIAQSSKVYITNSGYITNQILDMGNEVQEYDVYLNKSGYKDREANLILKYQNDIVDHYIDDMDEIFVLPESCLIIDGLITMSGSQTIYKTNLKFVVSELKKYQEENPDKKLILPVKLILLNESDGIELRNEKDVMLLELCVIKPYVKFSNSGMTIPVTIDLFRNPGLEKAYFPIELKLPFNNNKYTFDFTCETDPALLEEYNNTYGTSYEMLPPIYTIPSLKIESDEQACLANITVKCTDLSTAIGGREYMLPVRITNSGNDNIPIQEDAVCYFRIKLVAKWSGFWKNTIHADEYGLSTTPDNQYDIYLYSRADALKEIKDWSVLTALSKITDEEAIVCPGWSGTMIEQCSPIIKITNEDAGNGKLKVEILASWAYEVAAELTTTTSNNKSTYNPQTNEIHLDYTGSFSWGDFRFQRTFSGQIPN